MNALILGFALLGSQGTSSSVQPSLHKELEPFRPFIGKTYRGVFAESTPEKPMVDVAKFERAMNGMAIRSLHSVNDGMYGGESLIYWDAEKKSLVFVYVTTAGFATYGTIKATATGYSAEEDVKNNANGITKVRSTSTLDKNGGYVVKADYLANGEWKAGREVTYVEDAKATVVFK